MHQQRDPPMNDVDHVKFVWIRDNSRHCEKCHCGGGSRESLGTVASASELSKCFLRWFVTIVLCWMILNLEFFQCVSQLLGIPMEVECGHHTLQTWLGNCGAAGAVPIVGGDFNAQDSDLLGNCPKWKLLTQWALSNGLYIFNRQRSERVADSWTCERSSDRNWVHLGYIYRFYIRFYYLGRFEDLKFPKRGNLEWFCSRRWRGPSVCALHPCTQESGIEKTN